ncbi:hypothetical protein [Paenibacillus sp. 481]|uniref:hypothetical protein n=1 Tax=Paenibacillus sp. 481 TaxID=2835869 RepID=UPI001E5FCB7D|nr:hypothetical protein [Paenibacillus sp. 481]UHA74187.1 hypothetical protein KIK04_03340 [Paenibacillus sp. 481]
MTQIEASFTRVEDVNACARKLVSLRAHPVSVTHHEYSSSESEISEVVSKLFAAKDATETADIEAGDLDGGIAKSAGASDTHGFTQKHDGHYVLQASLPSELLAQASSIVKDHYGMM